MKKIFSILFLSLLIIAAVSACGINQDSYIHFTEEHTVPKQTDSFQEFLWEEHGMDLFIQIGLLLAGAFGVAALLPSADEE
jgi:hypothetical protein